MTRVSHMIQEDAKNDVHLRLHKSVLYTGHRGDFRNSSFMPSYRDFSIFRGLSLGNPNAFSKGSLMQNLTIFAPAVWAAGEGGLKNRLHIF